MKPLELALYLLDQQIPLPSGDWKFTSFIMTNFCLKNIDQVPFFLMHIRINTTGSRDAVTCAFHIILGENTTLDIVRLLSWKSRSTSTEELPRIRYAASFAG